MTPLAFAEAPDTSVLVCERVSRGEPVLYVAHDQDEGWQFLCGGDHEDDGTDGAVAAPLQQVVDADASLNDVALLPCGWHASRGAPGRTWLPAEDGAESD